MKIKINNRGGGGGWNKHVLGGKKSKNYQSGRGDDYLGLKSI